MSYREKMPDGTTRVTGATGGATGATGAQGPQGNPGTNGATPTLRGTSTTSTAIATGAKTFAISPSMTVAFPVGAVVRAYSAANAANYMTGVVTASAVNSITMTVTEIGGTGTFTDWTLVISGFTGPQGVPGTSNNQWNKGLTYVTGSVVGWGGRMWRALNPVAANVCPGLNMSVWTPLHAVDQAAWYLSDPNFETDSLTVPHEYFWKTGTVTTAYTTTAGEFETGRQALKCTMAVASSQRFYDKEENLVRGGEILKIEIRARLTAASAGTTILGSAIFNLADDPAPFAGTPIDDSLGAQALTTAWAWYTFYVVAPNALPRARVNIVANAPTTAGNVLIDRYKVSRVDTNPCSGVDTFKSVSVASLPNTSFNQITGFARVGDDARCFTFASDQWTCRVPGWYDINASITFGGSSATATRRIVGIFKNGVEERRNDISTVSAAGPEVTHKSYLAAGDVIEMRGYQNSGAALLLSSTGHIMQMQRICS